MDTSTPSTRPVRVRFAPSPTGDMHIGGGRTALFNWLFARHFGGQFILRIEDTDDKRFVENSQKGIIDGLHWLGLQWDEGPDIGGPYGPYVQSQRLPYYQEWAQWLVENGKAYRAYETSDEIEIISKMRQAKGLPPGYDGRSRHLTPDDWSKFDAQGKPYVIRFKMPPGETTFVDLVRGPITAKNETLQDTVILKSDGFPTYHLAHIVDDHMMRISHVIRAEEWINSTWLHWQLYTALGWEIPQIAHVPVILKIKGSGKMSKRDEGARISFFSEGGYLPEAVVNYLCNVGWNYGLTDEKGEEIQAFSKEDAAKVFDITRVSTSGTKFDMAKLAWLNGVYIRSLDDMQLARYLRVPLEKAGLEVNLDLLLKLIPLVRERLKMLNEIVDLAGFFFEEDIATPPAETIIQKGMTAAQARQALMQTHDTLSGLPEFTTHAMEEALRPLVEQLGVKPGQVFGALRVAVTGRAVSPPLFESMTLIGRETCLIRVGRALQVLAD